MDQDTLSSILSEPVLLVSGVLVGGLILCVFVTIWVVIGARHKTAEAKDREESRREIAAYVAEGTMTAEDAARLLTAGGSIGHRIMTELGDLKKTRDPRPGRGPVGSGAADEVLRPQAT